MSAILTTYTTVRSVLPAVDITTYYQDPTLGDILNVEINESYQILNGVPILEGYGIVIATNNLPTLIDLEIDIDGFLIVIGAEANNYDIDSDGNLTYTI